MPRPLKTKGPCLTPDCDGEQQVRGLCRACYQAFERDKFAGLYTDEQAVAAGLILPRHRCRRLNEAYYRTQRTLVFPSE